MKTKLTRQPKINFYLGLAHKIAKQGTCIRRNYGAVIVKDDEIIATGYTGSPRGTYNCCEAGECKRQAMGIKPGERYELCRSVHAEQNAIISASRQEMLGSDMYVVGIEMESGLIRADWPCLICKKLIINAGILHVFIPNSVRSEEPAYEVVYPNDWRMEI